MAKTNDAVWIEINIETLTDAQRAYYDQYKADQRRAAEARAKFETCMNEDMAQALPTGHKLVFGYRFGKLSAAVVADDSKPKAATPAKQSLADFIATQQAAGRRA